MSGFKRVSLAGSEELFRPTRPRVVDETDEMIREVVEPRTPAKEKLYRQLNLTPEEVELLLEAVQVAKYPDRIRPKPPLDKFERFDALKTKLQGEREE